VVYLRFGIVLSPDGGALKKMLPIFRCGAGGHLGSGRQMMSWIALPDVLGIMERALTDSTIKGPLNVVSPHPVTNEDFTRAMGRVLHRPTFLPVPAFAARLTMGEMAEELLLSSQRVEPQKLLKAGYAFQYPDLEPTLRALLRT
jgi:uncharacterized protein (TIGR01777 family)